MPCFFDDPAGRFCTLPDLLEIDRFGPIILGVAPAVNGPYPGRGDPRLGEGYLIGALNSRELNLEIQFLDGFIDGGHQPSRVVGGSQHPEKGRGRQNPPGVLEPFPSSSLIYLGNDADPGVLGSFRLAPMSFDLNGPFASQVVEDKRQKTMP